MIKHRPLLPFLIYRFGLMKKVTSMVLFKGFLVWCIFFSLMIQRHPFFRTQHDLLRYANVSCEGGCRSYQLFHTHVLFISVFFFQMIWIWGGRNSTLLLCFHTNVLIILFFFFPMNDQNQRKSELNGFRLCFSLSSSLYFLVTKKSLRLQVCVQTSKIEGCKSFDYTLKDK